MRIAAGIMAILTGLGFGIPGWLGLRHFARTGEIWTFMGFPTYGGGPFERMGLPTTTTLLGAFVGVCALEVLVGIALIAGWKSALWLSLVLLPVELAFWYGFSLPFGFVFGAIRAVLTIAVLASA